MIETAELLAVLRAEWDHLTQLSEQPLSAPAWVLAGWTAVASPELALRVVVVRRGEELAGMFPLVADGRAYVAMGEGVGSVVPFARPGLEEEVAAAFSEVLAEQRPRPPTIRFQQDDAGPDWAGLLTRSWPGPGAWSQVTESVGVPRVALGDGGFDAWFASKSSSFRREMRRKRKRLDEAGASFRFSSEDSFERDVAEFLRLHRVRLAGQGGTSLAADSVEQMLVTAGRELLPQDRLRLLMMEIDGKAIGAQLVLVAGSEATAWNSGFDEEYARLSPSMQCILHVLEDAAEKGQRSLCLGPGDQDYKARFADSGSHLVSCLMVPKGRGYARTRGRIAAAATGRAAKRRLATALPQSLHRAARALRG